MFYLRIQRRLIFANAIRWFLDFQSELVILFALNLYLLNFKTSFCNLQIRGQGAKLFMAFLLF